ncbi:hypothetical protein GOP47_0031075 [Adiantum capillus-veneris]|nr:hypothetical protein GOP47_0031075 [Adiantum capillus-veneris]
MELLIVKVELAQLKAVTLSIPTSVPTQESVKEPQAQASQQHTSPDVYMWRYLPNILLTYQNGKLVKEQHHLGMTRSWSKKGRR